MPCSFRSLANRAACRQAYIVSARAACRYRSRLADGATSAGPRVTQPAVPKARSRGLRFSSAASSGGGRPGEMLKSTAPRSPRSGAISIRCCRGCRPLGVVRAGAWSARAWLSRASGACVRAACGRVRARWRLRRRVDQVAHAHPCLAAAWAGPHADFSDARQATRGWSPAQESYDRPGTGDLKTGLRGAVARAEWGPGAGSLLRWGGGVATDRACRSGARRARLRRRSDGMDASGA